MKNSIMVFNDTLEIQQLFEDILSEAGYQVSARGYGTEDLEYVREHKPDLVIADCAPLEGEREGWQFVQKLKMSRGTERIPIILCSTSLRLIHELEGWLTGKNVIALPKPFITDELLEAVARLIGKVEAGQ